MDIVIVSSILSIGGLGLLFGAGLAYASKKFAVEIDPKIEKISEILPGANCGACGSPGCNGYAEAVVNSNAQIGIDLCTPGGADVSAQIASIMGLDAVSAKEPTIAVVQCQGDNEKSPKRLHYHGLTDCKAAELIMKGDKACEYGCLGMGTCVESCPFGAMIMGSNGLPIVLENKCTGCGMCVSACPRNIMVVIPKSQKIYLGCVSQDKAKAVKSVCTVGCTGCSLCSKPKVTPSGAIEMDGNLPTIKDIKADDLTNAVEKCPSKSFIIRK